MAEEIKSAVDIAMSGERPPIQHDETKMPELTGSWESQGNSQTEVDLNKFNEILTPPTNTVTENWDKNMSNSPSIVVATEKQTPVTPNVETRDLHQEALDSNKKANEGFVSGPVLSNTGRAFFHSEDIYKENAKLKEDLEALKIQVAELSKKFDDPNALQNALDPNRPKSKDQLEVDKAYATINKDLNQKALNEMAQVKAMLEPKPSVTPEVTELKKQRDFKTAALIAGVVAGGAAGILGGTTVGIPVAAAAGVVSIGGRISNYFLGRSITKIENQIKDPTLDGATREKLQKRESNLKKIQNVVQHVTKFATGAAIGAGISTFISNVAMGGHGLVWNKPEVPEGIPGGAEGSLGSTGIEQTQPTSTGETPLPESPETYPGNSLIRDGRVHLPGSAWDGNMAAGPAQDILPGGAGNFSNYTGGASEMAANQLGQDLASNNITDQLLSNLTTYDKHRLLTEYWNAVKAGNANPELIETLKSINTEGAQKLLAAIGK